MATVGPESRLLEKLTFCLFCQCISPKVQVILRHWDPICIAPGEFAPGDEYDDYGPQIVSRVMKGCSLEALTQYLSEIRTGVIGVEADPAGDRAIALEILEILRSNP